MKTLRVLISSNFLWIHKTSISVQARIQFYLFFLFHSIKLKLLSAKYRFFTGYKFNQLQASSYFKKTFMHQMQLTKSKEILSKYLVTDLIWYTKPEFWKRQESLVLILMWPQSNINFTIWLADFYNFWSICGIYLRHIPAFAF